MSFPTLLARLSLLLSLLTAALCSDFDPDRVRSPSGRHNVALSDLRRHLPSIADRAALISRLLEHDPSTNRLLHSSGHLDLSILAPHSFTHPPARYTVNGKHLPLKHGPNMRTGPSHSFVHDPVSGSLLAGWGPSLHLRRVSRTVFLNIHTSSSSNDRAIHTVSGRQFDAVQNETYHFRPNWQAERSKFFDIAMGFDSAFCRSHGGDPADVTMIVHGVAADAHRMTLTLLVTVRIGDVIGFCPSTSDSSPQDVTTPRQIANDESDLTIDESSSDRFGPPSRAARAACLAQGKDAEGKPLCTIPGLRLDTFRLRWKAYVGAAAQSDAVYLLTEADIDQNSSVIGAAWTGSACSDFGYGWAFGDHPVIIAHEIGHTLGAPHAKSGLMFPFLRLGSTDRYDGKSLLAIEDFIRDLPGLRCLRSSTTGDAGKRRLTSFVRINRKSGASGIIEGSDVAVASVRNEGRAALLMLQVQRYNSGGFGSGVRMTTLYRTADKGFPFSFDRPFKQRYVRASHALLLEAGGGIAVASVLDTAKDDVICVLVNRFSGRIFYSVGFDVDPELKSVVRAGWTGPRFLPKTHEGDIVGLGAAAGDVRGTGETDVVIAYLELMKDDVTNTTTVFARYVIGHDLFGRAAFARGGWSTPATIPLPPQFALPADPVALGDISVALWTIPADNGTDAETRLLFSFIARTSPGSGFRTFVCHTGNVNAAALVWNCYVPNVKPRFPQHMVGGVTLTRLLSPSAPVPTSVIFDSRHFATGSSSQWIDVADGVLTKQAPQDPGEPEQLAVSIGEDIVPADTCDRCYAPGVVQQCKRRVQTCFFKRQFGQVETVKSISRFSLLRQQTIGGASVSFSPNTDAIFCAGFHSIFVEQRLSSINDGGKCGWDSQRTSIIAEGLRVSIVDALGVDNVESSTANVTLGDIPEELEGIGTAKSVIDHIDVWVNTKKDIRYQIINKAFKDLQKKKDFKPLFLKLHPKQSKQFKVGKNRYKVSVAYSVTSKEVWLQSNAPEDTTSIEVQ